MRRLFLTLILGTTAAMSLCPAQMDMQIPGAAPVPPLQSFQGTGSTTTSVFQVQNRWEVRWNCRRPLTITVYGTDHTVVASTSGVYYGSFSLAAGGGYYLQIDGQQPPVGIAPQPTTPQPAPSNPMGSIDDPISNTVNNPPPSNNNPNPNGGNYPPNFNQFYIWNVSVIGQPGNGAPQPVAAITPNSPNAATTPPAPQTKLTEDQARAVVLITGDNAEGTGFLVKTPDGPCVVTNLHVIGNNPNIKITTNTGAQVKMLSAKGASDRDLALLSIQDDKYSYLEMNDDISHTVQAGDEVITPGNSQGGEVMLNTGGKVLGIGPERIEIDNPIYHGNSGGPVFHTKSGKVLGVVTEAIKVDTSDELDKTSFASRNSAINSSMRYFGLRLDTIAAWVPIDWRRFQTETAFLDQFDLQSRSLDSYMNPPTPPPQGSGAASTDSNADARLYLSDKKIVAARDTFIQQATDNDGPQRVQAFKELLFELDTIADTDMSSIKDMTNFYPFDQARAKEEIAYRQALKDELDSVGNDVSRMNGLARRSSGSNDNNQ